MAERSAVKGDPSAVRKSVEIAAPQRTAFRVFAERMTTWWPLESHHIGAVAAAEVVIEPRVELEHRHLDRFGPKRDEMRGAFDSPGGWQGILKAFSTAAETAASKEGES
jgi:hypothetical protein